MCLLKEIVLIWEEIKFIDISINENLYCKLNFKLVNFYIFEKSFPIYVAVQSPIPLFLIIFWWKKIFSLEKLKLNELL